MADSTGELCVERILPDPILVARARGKVFYLPSILNVPGPVPPPDIRTKPLGQRDRCVVGRYRVSNNCVFKDMATLAISSCSNVGSDPKLVPVHPA